MVNRRVFQFAFALAAGFVAEARSVEQLLAADPALVRALNLPVRNLLPVSLPGLGGGAAECP